MLLQPAARRAGCRLRGARPESPCHSAFALHCAAGNVTLLQQAESALPEFGPDLRFLAATLGEAAPGKQPALRACRAALPGPCIAWQPAVCCCC